MAKSVDFQRLPTEFHVLRLALVLVFFAFGYVKFFAFEADGVAPLISVHPALSWLGPAFGHAGASAFLGMVEITTGLLLLAGLRSSWANVLGGALTVITFSITVTLIFFLPDVFEKSAGGFPAISGTGGFLLKDSVLLAGGLVFLLHGLRQVRQKSEQPIAVADV